MEGGNEVGLQRIIKRLHRDLPDYRNGDFHLWLLKIMIKTCRPLMKRSHSASAVDQSLQDFLAILPPNLRLVIVLVDLLGLDYTQAAIALGVPRWMVRRRLAQARQLLSDMPEGDLESAYALQKTF
jgi:DNA-directed RNA polymerase specialized sigma24 family protein